VLHLAKAVLSLAGEIRFDTCRRQETVV